MEGLIELGLLPRAGFLAIEVVMEVDSLVVVFLFLAFLPRQVEGDRFFEHLYFVIIGIALNFILDRRFGFLLAPGFRKGALLIGWDVPVILLLMVLEAVLAVVELIHQEILEGFLILYLPLGSELRELLLLNRNAKLLDFLRCELIAVQELELLIELVVVIQLLTLEKGLFLGEFNYLPLRFLWVLLREIPLNLLIILRVIHIKVDNIEIMIFLLLLRQRGFLKIGVLRIIGTWVRIARGFRRLRFWLKG